jgi:hypothetical protein
MMKKILLLMVCGLFTYTLNAQTATNESPYGESVNSDVNTDTQNVITLSASDRVIITKEDLINKNQPVAGECNQMEFEMGDALCSDSIVTFTVNAGCDVPAYNDFAGSKTQQSDYVYYGKALPSVSGIDSYEWWTEPGTGWTVTDRNLGLPMQYVQITGSASSTTSILRVRAHNSCGWSYYQIVNYVGPIR